MVAGPGPASREGHDLSAGEFARLAARVLGESPFPSLVLEVPSERIVASSPGAQELLDPGGGVVVGRHLEQFTADRPVLGSDLLAGGRMNGFETFRVLRRPHGADLKVRMWIRTFDHQPPSRFVLVVIVADQSTERAVGATHWQDAPAVMGTADASLIVERISGDAAVLFGRSVAGLIGQSMIGLVAEEDVPSCLAALSEASASQNGVTLYLDIRSGTPDSPAVGTLSCEVLILPLQPSPSCAFVFLPTPTGMSRTRVSAELSGILGRLGRGADVAQLARGVFSGITEQDVAGLSRLTTRELEIVTRLLDGDRAPAIATRLFLSQSTVRNHLASVFGKLGVTSQQELFNLFRDARSGTGRP
jgi:DNA-binding CsgD family transcriptional regulator